MATIYEIRRDNLRRLIRENGGGTSFSKRLPKRYSPSYLTQLAGPNPNRKIHEDSAREIENALGLDHDWLDTERDEFDRVVAPRVNSTGPSDAVMGERQDYREQMIQALGNVLTVCKAHNMELPPKKITELAALACEQNLSQEALDRIVSLMR